MNDLSEKLKIHYIDFNKSDKKHFTDDPLNFTDSSHLRFSSTEKFNSLLVKELKKKYGIKIYSKIFFFIYKLY